MLKIPVCVTKHLSNKILIAKFFQSYNDCWLLHMHVCVYKTDKYSGVQRFFQQFSIIHKTLLLPVALGKVPEGLIYKHFACTTAHTGESLHMLAEMIK